MNGLWRYLEHWLMGESVSLDADERHVSIQATWSIPLGLIALILLLSAAVMLVVYWHESGAVNRVWKVILAGIRTALVGVILVMLLGWTVQRHRTDLPDVVVILDDSASMGLIDAEDDPRLASLVQQRLATAALDEATRLNLAKILMLEGHSQFLNELSRRYNVRFFLAGGSARALGGQQNGIVEEVRQIAANESVSRLGNCVRDVLETQRGRPTAAIIMLTDGVTTEGRSLTDAAQFARRRSVPVFFVGLGSERPRSDLRVADLLVDETAFVGDVLHFDARLISHGYTGSAVVRLKRADDSATLAEQTIALDLNGAAHAIRLTHRVEKAGEFEYVIEVTPRDGESDVENNRLISRVVVRDEAIRVLLVQAYPSYEFRFLKQMLLRQLNDQQSAETRMVGFRTILQEADLEYVVSDKTAERAFPASREELFQYDVLIFGDVNPALLSPSIMHNIYEFVTVRGGGLIVIAGPRYTPLAYRDSPLAPLMPMNLDTVSVPDSDAQLDDSFRPHLTPLGLASPVMQLADVSADNEKLWREELAPLRWFASAPDLRAGVRVLAEHPTRRTERGGPLPVICLQFIGAGKVIFHATDETHRWRFQVGDVYFARYWVQTIRYLCRAKLLLGSRVAELSTDRAEYRPGETVNLRVRFLDDRAAPAADDGVVVVVERVGAGPEGQATTGVDVERRSATLHRHVTDRGVFEGSAGPLPAGRYSAWVAAPPSEGLPPSQRFAVVALPGELARTQMDAVELREAAKISGGRFYTFGTSGRLLADLPRGRQVRIESLPPKPIWNVPLVAALFVALIATEWLLRRRFGLL